MFRVKICGITNVEDAIAAVEAGADAIGLNFYEKSPRCIDAARSEVICAAFGYRALSVGVFVNCERTEIERMRTAGHFRSVQLHGDEAPGDVAYFRQQLPTAPSTAQEILAESLDKAGDGAGDAFRSRAREFRRPTVIRARRVDDSGVSAIAADFEACVQAGGGPGAVLVDAAAPGQFGGTGQRAPWEALANYQQWLGETPLILAGGLTPDNVAEAIRIVRPAAVDVASGVESSPGKKDPVKVRDFVANALGAFDALG